jgi:hypothetical protein
MTVLSLPALGLSARRSRSDDLPGDDVLLYRAAPGAARASAVSRSDYHAARDHYIALRDEVAVNAAGSEALVAAEPRPDACVLRRSRCAQAERLLDSGLLHGETLTTVCSTEAPVFLPHCLRLLHYRRFEPPRRVWVVPR